MVTDMKILVGFIFLLAGCFTTVSSCKSSPSTLLSESPDGKWRATLIEKSIGLDRQFEVRLQSIVTGNNIKLVYSSPDEGPPGTERFIWSSDGRVLVLVGKNLYTGKRVGDYIRPIENIRLNTGEVLYLKYDTIAEQVWCNSHQQRLYPPFTFLDLSKIEFRESLILASE